MKLSDLLKFKKVTIQCHDNPDPDAIASGFGLYLYLIDKGVDAKIIYGGRDEISKANIKLMIDELHIPVTYYPEKNVEIDGLLVTIDCQAGESNVTPMKASTIAVIDHHQSSFLLESDMALTEIHPDFGSCSTLIWKMLKEENFPIEGYRELCTALFYGLMTDTGDFVEIKHPLDRDMRDDLTAYYDRNMVSRFSNSKISLKELEIAGVALIRYVYNPDNRYAIVHAQPCDPNVLGYIIDLVLQVDVVDVCVIFNEKADGFKFSTRSCIKEVHADELAAFLADDIGGGGGHIDKAGGFISKSKFYKKCGDTDIDTYIGMRMNKYYATSEVIHAGEYDLDISQMEKYVKLNLVVGYADPLKLLPMGTGITIRTLEGDIDMNIRDDYYLMIGIKGEVYPVSREKFARTYDLVDEPYEIETEYLPTIRSKEDGTTFELTQIAESCKSNGTSYVLARELDHTVKIFTAWDRDNYYLGKPGDFMVCPYNNPDDVYIVARDIFIKSYQKCD